MIHSLRAFIWLRWRLLANSILSGRRRDRMEQVSRALALFVPIILIALSFGSIVAIGALGFLGGRALATGVFDPPVVVLILRAVLAGSLIFVVIMATVSPGQSSTARYTRLLLLPIHRQALHLVEVLAGLADPAVVFVLPGLLLFAAGLAFYGRPVGAAIALVAGLSIIALLATLASLLSFLVAWLLRSRRRGELFTLAFVLVISLVSLVPALIGESLEGRARDRRRAGGAATSFSIDDFDRRLPVWTRALPSELYSRAVREGMAGNTAAAGFAVMLLVAEGGLLFLASAAVHRRLLTALEGDRSRRRGGQVRAVRARVPFLGPQAAAVAWAQMRTGLRSVRGRLLVLMPGPMVAMLTLLFRQMPDDERWAGMIASNGHLIVGAGIVFSLYAMQALTMNMFGSDRAGLTLQLLGPITDGQLARGKVAGCGMVFGVSMALAVVAALAVAPNSSPFLWIAVVLGGAATYLLLSPLCVWFSALLPVASDLSKTGSGGNPHAFPMLAGTFLVLILGSPTALIIVAAQFWLERPALAPLLMLAWLVLATAIAIPLVGLASRAIGVRRENLALVAQGK